MKVLLAVTGCIAAYKSCELVRILQKNGHEVRVIMTEAATKFVSTTTFAALTNHPVLVHEFAEHDDCHGELLIPHVELAREADLIVVAPATANTLSKLAHGLADNLVSATLLAAQSPILVAPAMNTRMYTNPATQNSLSLLLSRGIHVVEPKTGTLACGDEGVGKLAELEDIHAEIEKIAAKLNVASTHITRDELKSMAFGQNNLYHEAANTLIGKRVLITAGPTHEYLDPVRYIGNPSTGKMGIALAAAFLAQGATVDLVLGPTAESVPSNSQLDVTHVTSATEMLNVCKTLSPRANIVVCAAAVSDYRPATTSGTKLKKGIDKLDRIDLAENPDILKSLCDERKPGQLIVGFAAETNDVIQNAQLKLAKKGCDLVVANDVSKQESTFGSDTNHVYLVSKQGITSLELMTKAVLAQKLVDHCIKLLNR